MDIIQLLNNTVTTPFIIIYNDTSKITHFNPILKELLSLADIDEMTLKEFFTDGIAEAAEIKLNEKYKIFNNKSIYIEKITKIDYKRIFVAFSFIDNNEDYVSKIRKDNLFKQMLLKISTDFISMPVENIDESINKALKVLGEFNEADRSYVFQYSDDLKYKSNTHEWCREGVEPQKEFLQNYPVMSHTYSAGLMLSGSPMIINDMDDLPEEAQAEKTEYVKEGIKALIILPMMYRNKAIGFIGYDSCQNKRNWNEDDIYLLKFVGDIITSAIIRAKSEKKLRWSEERYRSFFENSGLGIFHTSLDGRLLRFNQALFDLSEYETKEKFQQEFTPENIYRNPAEREEFVNTLKTEGHIKGFETVLIKAKGNDFPARLNAKLINDGKELFIEGFVEDITEKKEYEDALVIARNEAEKNNQLKSNFLAQVSHEIRTPINTILSFSQLLAEELKGQVDQDLEYSFSTMDSAGKRIIRTIDLILDMSQIQTGTFELIQKKFDANEIIKKLYQEYNYLAKERKLEFKINLTSDENIVFADVYTVEQILSNLIHNAIKYTDEGKIEVITRDSDNQHIIEVADTGIGISEEFLPSLFTAFTQESQGYTRKYEGNGLGLALVKQYCEMNNIEIKVESEKNVGSVFRLIFDKSNQN